MLPDYSQLLWLLLPVAAASGWWLARRNAQTGGRNSSGSRISPDYFKGLIGLDRKQRIIMLSIKARETDEEAATVQEYSADAAGTTKLGDILKEQLDSK